MKDLEKRISALEKRNKKVEADKSWETSWTRRIAIATLTYLVVCTYLAIVIGIDPWFNALVPVVGYLLSTLTLGVVKNYWLSDR